MSKDIRSFFQVLSKKSGDQQKPPQKPKKVPALIIDSDEDVIDKSPDKPAIKKIKSSKRKKQVLSSDSEDEKPKKTKSPPKKANKLDEKPKLKPVSIDLLDRPVTQSKVEHIPEANKYEVEHKKKDTGKRDQKKSKKKNKAELATHKDKDFEKTLEDLDEDSDDTILLENLDILDRTIEDATLNENCIEVKEKDSKTQIKMKILEEPSSTGDKKYKGQNKINFDKLAIDAKGSSSSNDNIDKHQNGHTNKTDQREEPRQHDKNKEDEKTTEKAKESKATPKKAEKRPRKQSESTPTPKKKQKLEHADSGIDPDLEKWEKKRYSAGLYQAYLHRPGPKNHGQKEYPKGKPDCLRGLVFLRTGVLDSLEGEEFHNLVSDHGGKVVSGVSKKVNYIVLGDDPGPAKIEKARNYKIPEINEDEFLDMILVKSGLKPKYAVNNSSEDLGLGASENGSEDNEICDRSLEKEMTSESMEKEHVKVETKKDSPKNSKLGVQGKSELRKEEESSVKKNIKVESKEDSPKDSKFVAQGKSKETNKSEKEDLSLQTESKSTITIKQELSAKKDSPKESTDVMSWTEKYKPSSIKDIIGQQDQNSNMNKLKKWLSNWFKNQEPERRKKMIKPSPFNPHHGGEYFKAALLSGSPGVGKTTTATLVAKELGFDIVEFNASDTRNKKLLHEEISQMMSSKTVAGFASGEKSVNKKRVLLMDEVDGMAGNEDRGGIAELINFIKKANFPIICMCNNRDHQKMRTLVTHCYELKYGKPNVNQVRGAMLSICFKEGLKIKPDSLSRLIVGTGCDIRQTLNHLAMWSAAEKDISSDVVQKESKNSQKDVVMGPWDVVRTLFTKSLNKDMSLMDKSRLFFYDYSLGPLFVQENYIHVEPELTGHSDIEFEEDLIRRYLTADSLSKGDMIDSKIRSTNNWALLESQAFYSAVLPSHYMSGSVKKINFPSWFGLNSRRTKKLRIVSELYSHARTRVSGDKNSMHLDYAEYLRNLLIRPLKEKGAAGVDETLEVMQSYSLLRDDMLNLFDLLSRFGSANMYEKIDAKVKVALTKQYNKKMVLSFAPPAASKKKKAAKGENEDFLDEEEEEESEEEDDGKVTEDALIKVKPKAKAGSSSSKQDSKSKGKSGAENKSKGKSSKSESKTSKNKGKK